MLSCSGFLASNTQTDKSYPEIAEVLKNTFNQNCQRLFRITNSPQCQKNGRACHRFYGRLETFQRTETLVHPCRWWCGKELLVE